MNPLLGVAMGAGANQYLKLEDNARANRKDERDTALNERQVKTADMQLEQGRMAIDKLRQKEDLGRLYRNAATGDPDALNQVMGRYNSNVGPFSNNLKVVPQGDRYDFADAKGNVVQSIPNDPQALRPVLQQAYLNELSYLDDNAMYKGMEHSQRERQLGSQEKYQQGILDWHEKQASRPQFMQDGTGRVLAISPEGKLVGTYGSARPVVGGGSGGGGIQITPQQQEALSDLNRQYGATDDPKQQAAIARRFQLLQNEIAIANKKFPVLGAPMTKDPAAPQQWKYNTDQTQRLNESTGEVEQLSPKTGAWTPVGAPTLAQPAAQAGVGVVRLGGNGGFGYRSPSGNIYDNPDEAVRDALSGSRAPKTAIPAKSAPATTFGSDEFDVMMRDARNGGATGRNYLRQVLDSNELTLSQRQQVESIMRGR